ncbi:restriction endonuclease subunit S [Methanobrevibacter smithii]|uniref:restriction endonuclease subunit S n=1 Tax=Methanobrevibacter smithii TaxID=2173 RepID=UPI0037DCB7E1
MSLEWNEVKLEDVGKIITGKTPKTSIEDNYGGHIPFLTPSDDMNVKIIKYTNKTLTLKGLNEVKNCLIPKNSVCVSCIGSDLGKVVLTSEDTVTNQQINSIIVNEKFDYNFIYYTMILLGKQLNYMSKSSTAVPIINKSTFSNELIFVPSLEEQKKISSILSNIDAKIDNLDKINKNLEEQIETIYNSFFVYYDDFSKEELEECEIGLIPKDWELMSLGEVTTKIKEKVGSDDYKVFSAVNTGNLILSEEYFDKQVYSKNIEKYIVVKQKEFAYNPARINIGSIGRNDFNYDGCVSPVYVAFKVEEGYENFMNMYIKSNRFNQWVVTLSSGSVRQTLNYADFSIIKIAYPPKDLVNKFNKVYDNYYEVINYNNSVISNLENIRDTLLPKLMSGEIDVSKINCDLE